MVLYNALTVVYLYERSLHIVFFFFIVRCYSTSKRGRPFYSPSSPHLLGCFPYWQLGICLFSQSNQARNVLKRERELWLDHDHSGTVQQSSCFLYAVLISTVPCARGEEHHTHFTFFCTKKSNYYDPLADDENHFVSYTSSGIGIKLLAAIIKQCIDQTSGL